jgi:hypothetical protein
MSFLNDQAAGGACADNEVIIIKANLSKPTTKRVDTVPDSERLTEVGFVHRIANPDAIANRPLICTIDVPLSWRSL